MSEEFRKLSQKAKCANKLLMQGARNVSMATGVDNLAAPLNFRKLGKICFRSQESF